MRLRGVSAMCRLYIKELSGMGKASRLSIFDLPVWCATQKAPFLIKINISELADNLFTIYILIILSFAKKAILLPPCRVIEDIMGNSLVFPFITDNMVVVIGLKKMIGFIVFGDV